MHLAAIDVSILAVVLASVAHFVLGAIWYSPMLFSKQWAAALNIKMDGSGGSIAMPLVVNALGCLVTSTIVGILYLWGGGDGPLDGIVCGLLVGACIIAVENLNRPMYERAPWALYWINSGYSIAAFALVGLVYSLIA